MNAIKKTDFRFTNDQHFYQGKVRDVYTVRDKVVLIATDRISAFDHVLREAIPYKGQVLNQISAYFLEQTKSVVPNWFEHSPDPNVSVGKACEPIRLEMVVRGYLCGHAWRVYRTGERILCGVTMPEGLKENDRFPYPIITPSLKAEEGHDEDISKEQIIDQKIVSPEDYAILEEYTLKLFDFGTKIANQQDLILVDTKYEFGKYKGEIMLMDEVHTPDSSRYFYSDGYEKRQAKGKKQKQLSKEFVREWLIDQGFQGKEGQVVPELPTAFVEQVTTRYVELFEKITGKAFNKAHTTAIENRILENVRKSI